VRGVDELRSARTKLQRAEEHLGQLRAGHDRFIQERNPYRMLRETDPRDGFSLWRVKIVEQPPLEKWASLAGESVHAMRSALDHTANALVPPKHRESSRVEFPIAKDQSWFDEHASTKLPGVGKEVFAEVEAAQPYNGQGAADPLWVLSRLDIIDKHRRLNVVSAALHATSWDVQGGNVVDVEPNFGPFIDGTAVIRFRMVPDPGSPMHVRQGVGTVLEGLLAYTGSVISRFDRFF
jgi:hypothetical protein